MSDKFDELAKGLAQSVTRRGLLSLTLSVAGLLAGLNTTQAATLTVLNTLDKGKGSLRNAINNAKDGDKIVFDAGLAGQTITLTSDQLSIKKNLDIEGPGAGLLTISGNDTTATAASIVVSPSRSESGIAVVAAPRPLASCIVNTIGSAPRAIRKSIAGISRGEYW